MRGGRFLRFSCSKSQNQQSANQCWFLINYSEDKRVIIIIIFEELHNVLNSTFNSAKILSKSCLDCKLEAIKVDFA